jgi:hypothetical protein
MSTFVLPGPIPIAFGDKAVSSITMDDVEAFRAARKAEGLSAVTVNHDLKLLRKMLDWGVRSARHSRWAPKAPLHWRRLSGRHASHVAGAAEIVQGVLAEAETRRLRRRPRFRLVGTY